MKNDPITTRPFDPVYARLFALHETSRAEARRVAHELANHEARHLVHGEWSPEAQGNTKARIAHIYATLAEVALNAAVADAALLDTIYALTSNPAIADAYAESRSARL